ncbi:MAG: hypothetical protein QGH06_04445 [Lutibacter sp.]|jgi:hypothetical protein|nr:hypothetical protein [Lutibacter sp.]
MNTTEQIGLINEAINKTKEQLRPLGVNFIFWGLLIIAMSLGHWLFPAFIQMTSYSALLYWTLLPVLAMVYTVYYNIQVRDKTGYETHIGRVLKIIWSVFNISWITIVIAALSSGQNPSPTIIFLLGITVLSSGLIIKSRPVSLGGGLLFLLYIGHHFYPEINPFMLNILGLSFGLLIPGFSLYYHKNDA